MDKLNWSFEQDAAGCGVVKHHATPRFSAHWTSGAGEVPTPPAQCWKDEGSGDGEDGLQLFGFQWIDLAPAEAADFERLMQDAAKAVDAWIASRL